MANTGQDPAWIDDKIQVASIKEQLKLSDFASQEWPKITVVTPSFNSAEYIEETIRSVNFQFYPNIQYIVSDNCSSDGTREILCKYDFLEARITSDKGQADALNRAFKTAQGEILTWLNADDLFAPFALYKMALAFKRGNADLIAGQAVLFEDGKAINRHIYSLPDGPLLETEILNLKGMWLTGQYFYQPELFFTKDIYERAGGYVNDKLFFSMDYELWLRMARAGAQIETISTPVALYRKHRDQKTNDTSGYESELKQLTAGVSPAKTAPKGRFSGFEWSTRLPKVVMLNDLGFQYGAGIAHESFVKALKLLGCEVQAYALADTSNSAEISKEPDHEALFAKIRKIDPDLVIVGNLHGAEKDHSWLATLLSDYPVFFVMHDFHMLTGRCAYFDGCKKYLDLTCDETCPTFFEYPILSTSKIADAVQGKANLLEHPNAFFIAYSDYAANVVKNTLKIRGFSKSAIRKKAYSAWLGVDTENYFLETEKRRADLRESFKLPTGKSIVLLPSGNYNDRRKNLQAAWRIFCALPEDSFHAIIIGETPISPDLLGDNFTHMHYISDRARLSSLFRCSDFVINTSHDETFGQTIVEGALSGALPVSTGKGAVPEIINLLGAGFQASLPNSESDAIAAAIQYMISLASNPRHMFKERLSGSLRAQCLFSIDALSRHLHLVMKQSGILARHNIKSKIDLGISPPVPAVEITLNRSDKPRWRQDDKLDSAFITSSAQSDYLPIYDKNYQEFALSMIEELRHIIPELNEIYQQVSDRLYSKNLAYDDKISTEIVDIVKEYKEITQKSVKYKTSKMWK